MNKSQLKPLAKSILKKLEMEQSNQDVCIYVNSYNNNCEISFYSDMGNYPGTCMEFNYINQKLPTVEHIEEQLYNTFIKTN